MVKAFELLRGSFNNGRLYYSIWVEDKARPDPTRQNEIYSIALDPNGDFTGVRQLQIKLPSYLGNTWSSPVSDIAFTKTGRMRIAER